MTWSCSSIKLVRIENTPCKKTSHDSRWTNPHDSKWTIKFIGPVDLGRGEGHASMLITRQRVWNCTVWQHVWCKPRVVPMLLAHQEMIAPFNLRLSVYLYKSSVFFSWVPRLTIYKTSVILNLDSILVFILVGTTL